MKELIDIKEKHQEALGRYVKALKVEKAAQLEREEAKRDLNRVKHEMKDTEDKIINEVEQEVINKTNG